MHNRIHSILKKSLISVAVVGLTATLWAQGAGVAGKWTWSTPGRNGGEPRKSTLTLKVEGEKLTGTLNAPGRGGQATDIEITDGKVKGDEVSFKIVREFNGNKFTMNYSGKVEGDVIKGKMESERNGNTQSRNWEAKREK